MHTVAMGWADRHIARLALGETVQFRPRGQSMTGKIASGQLCTVQPLGELACAECWRSVRSSTFATGTFVVRVGHHQLRLLQQQIAVRGIAFVPRSVGLEVLDEVRTNPVDGLRLSDRHSG